MERERTARKGVLSLAQSAPTTCRGCGALTITPAAEKGGARYVFLRCMAENPPFGPGRVLEWVKAEYAEGAASELRRPAWCEKEV